jgi:ABC-type Fe3+ transport system substrate-binding protein
MQDAATRARKSWREARSAQRRLSGLGLLIGLSVALAACGASTGGAPKPVPAQPPAASQPAATGAASAGAQPVQQGGAGSEWDQLVAAAKEEGELVLVGPSSQEARDALNNTFAKEFGIRVNYIASEGPEYIAKLKAERPAGRFTVDAVINGAPSWFRERENLLTSLRAKLILPEVTDPNNWLEGRLWWADKEEDKLLRLAVYVNPNLVVNPDQVDSRTLTSWDALMDPKYKGKMTSQTATRPGPGGGTAAYLYYVLGPEKFKALYVDQAVVYTDEVRQAAESVARGTYPIGLGIDGAFIEPLRTRGLKMEVVRPSDAPGYLSSGFTTLMLVDRPPHPSAAQLFANWAAARAGNETITKALHNVSARRDITSEWAPDYTRPKNGIQYMDSNSWQYLTEIRPAAEKGVQEAIGR